MKTVFLRTVELVLLSLALGVAAGAQTGPMSTPVQTPEAAGQDKLPRRPGKRVPQPPALVTVIPSEPPTQPQVVTIIHRLSGVKVLRMLLRQAGGGVVETIDPQTITSDAHASIIAGWALEDGKTIAARLPQAAAEFEVTEFMGFLPDQKLRVAGNGPFPFVRTRVEPDLTVVTADGRKLRARLVGLDAETGLSVLQVVGASAPAVAASVPATSNLVLGQAVEIFAPEPARPEGEASTRITFVKVGKFAATVSNPVKINSGFTEKLTLRSAKLSPDLIGGVVCDSSGATVGIVDSIEGSDAQIVASDTIRAATQRVLERQASVPRPLLGVRGEPVEFAVRSAFLANGWHEDQLKDLIAAQSGILLTSVVPRTPAALANLKAGDVILSVNDFEVKTAEQFSKLLGNAGSGEQVRFTIRRPDTAAPFSIPVTLGGSFSPLFEGRFELPRMAPQLFGLQQLGIRTMELTSQAATNLGAQHGLIVVGVQPDSPAARGGMREGDVIEAIDGRIAARGLWAVLSSTPQKKHTFWIVREGEKKKVIVGVE
jgi:S1-C subfamily serine protease